MKTDLQRTATIPAALSRLIGDYLDESPDLGECYAFSPSFDGLREAARQRGKFKVDRKTLHTVLREQAESSSYVTEAALANIDALARDDAFTITTGHQLCLCGGPLFFLYKIVSAIKWCKRLQTEGIRAVPVYWMASEDHDFEEINHVYVREQRVEWKAAPGGPVGRLGLEGIEGFHRALEQLLADDYCALEELEALKAIFRPGRTLAEAVRDFVYRLFGAQGIVVIDAADERLKALFRPLMERELETSFSAREVEATSERLRTLGYAAQATPRDINLFWMEEGLRERIVRQGEGFALGDGSREFTASELAGTLQSAPGRFSPNVVLRPLYQEWILPNLAYIGGPGELSYWLQLKGVFDRAGAFFPVVLLRDMAVVTDEKARKKAAQLGISLEDLAKGREPLLRELLRARGTREHFVESRAEEVYRLMEVLKGELKAVDPTLERSTGAEQQRFSRRFEALRKKVLRAEKRNNEVLMQRLDALFKAFYPTGSPQERVVNYLDVYPDASGLISALLELAAEPFGHLKVLPAPAGERKGSALGR